MSRAAQTNLPHPMPLLPTADGLRCIIIVPGDTTCLFVKINPRFLSTTKPVAYADPAGSVSKGRT